MTPLELYTTVSLVRKIVESGPANQDEDALPVLAALGGLLLGAARREGLVYGGHGVDNVLKCPKSLCGRDAVSCLCKPLGSRIF